MKSLGQVEFFYQKKSCSISVESFVGEPPYILDRKMYANFPEFEQISADKESIRTMLKCMNEIIIDNCPEVGYCVQALG